MPDRLNDVFNVKDFGARPSNRLGGPDCSTAINDAVNAAVASGGGVVFFLPDIMTSPLLYMFLQAPPVCGSSVALDQTLIAAAPFAAIYKTICCGLIGTRIIQFAASNISDLSIMAITRSTVRRRQTIQPVRDRETRPPITTTSCSHRSSDQITYIIAFFVVSPGHNLGNDPTKPANKKGGANPVWHKTNISKATQVACGGSGGYNVEVAWDGRQWRIAGP